MTRFYAIIPARGGSKRVPKKNIAPINGTPLIAITIGNLIDSEIFEGIFVSSDSDEIRSISLEYGASCPFLRPAELSNDYTPTIDVIKHALNSISVIKGEDIVMCVYPTSALITSSLYQSAKSFFLQKQQELSFLISVTQYPHPIQRSLKLDIDSRIEFTHPEYVGVRTQDLNKTHFDAGQFYIGKKSTWLNSNSIFDNSYGFEISRNSFIDIDYPEDLEELRKRIKSV